LDFASSCGTAYVDVELAAFQKDPLLADAQSSVPRQNRAGLILSSHDFSGRPPRLTNLFSEMEHSVNDVNKLVWTARTLRDNIEAFELLSRPSKPTIALCMGEAGLISRVLAKKFGAFLTFCGIRSSEGTARGQLSLDEMKRLYRWDAIGPRTKVCGVVGSLRWPFDVARHS